MYHSIKYQGSFFLYPTQGCPAKQKFSNPVKLHTNMVTYKIKQYNV